MKKITNEEFLAKALERFGDKFTYLTPYLKATTKLKIKCPEHGVFDQSPTKHLTSKYGCPTCAGMFKKTHEQFVEEANKVHQNKFTYPEQYKGCDTPLNIMCSEHGLFKQKPSQHLMGQQCKICSRIRGNQSKTYTLEEFVIRARVIYGDKYTYIGPYNGSAKKMHMWCPEHGDFFQSPHHHLHGSKCKKCGFIEQAAKIRKSHEAFIDQANAIYNGKYQYISTYTGCNDKIEIKCPAHGIFWQTAGDHINYGGCSICSMIERGQCADLKTFIEQSDRLHPGQFDYSLSVYTASHDRLKIICNECADIFEQTPSNHLSGKGCANCKGVIKRTNEDFIQEAIEVHGEDRYCYSLVDYKDSKTNVKILCNECDHLFEQAPQSHINRKCGCPICAIWNNAAKRTKTVEQFISDAVQVFGDDYDFQETKYLTCELKVKITCKKCNTKFEQSPISFLKGRGCKKCHPSRISIAEINWLNSLNMPEEYCQYSMKVGDVRFFADAYDPITNTVYEFNGDYYHGNPERFKPEILNTKVKKTFGELYQKTLNKEQIIKQAGYNFVSIWEGEWNKIKDRI